jgi:signal transduction histidine kinase
MRLEMLLDNLSESDRKEIREDLQLMQDEAARCGRITEKLLDFSRADSGERNTYDVTAIIQEVAAVVKHLGKFRDRQIVINTDDPVYAWTNGPEIKQVILNLVANGLEAMEPGGEMQIQLLESPDHIEIDFIDSGCGMTQEVIAHIFEPFFTTKEVGKGTGLGLSISHRIVRDHGGTLEAESDGPGMGSTFRLRLPKRAESLAQRAA